MNSFKKISLTVFVFSLFVVAFFNAGTETNIIVTIHPNNVINNALPEVGYNNHMSHVAYNMENPAFISAVKNLNLEWIRWPAGTANDSFDWRTGYISRERNTQLMRRSSIFQDFFKEGLLLKAKGPQGLLQYSNVASQLGLKLVVNINGFTSSPEETDQLAKYCKDHGIVVAAWQFSNEPYYFDYLSNKPANFYLDAADYADKMKLYHNAVRRHLPHAETYLYYSTTGNKANWDQILRNYPDPYWTGITYHTYEGGRGTSFDEAMRSANTALRSIASRVDDPAGGYISNSSSPQIPIMITELNGSLQNDNIMKGSMYNALFLVDSQLKLSVKPNIKYLASFRLSNGAIDANEHLEEKALAMYHKNLSFDGNGQFTFSERFIGTALKWIHTTIINSQKAVVTTVSGSPNVSAEHGQSIPAIHAQAYIGRNNKNYLVVTNKSANSYNLKVRSSNALMNNSHFTIKRMYSVNPANRSLDSGITINENISNQSHIQIPAYSIVHLTWTANNTIKPKQPYISKIIASSDNGKANVIITAKLSPLVPSYDVIVDKIGTTKTRTKTNIATNLTKYNQQQLRVFNLGTHATYSFRICPSGTTEGPHCSASVNKYIGPPSAIGFIQASKGDFNDVILHWDSSLGANTYQVFIRTTTLEGSTEQTINTDMSSYTLTHSQPGTSYTFDVKAINSFGESPVKSGSFTNNGDVVRAPVDVFAQKKNGNKCTIKWTPAYQDYKNIVNFEDNTTGSWTFQQTASTISDYTRSTVVNKGLEIEGSNKTVIGKIKNEQWENASLHFDLIDLELLNSNSSIIIASRFKDQNNLLGLMLSPGTTQQCSNNKISVGFDIISRIDGNETVLKSLPDMCLSKDAQQIGFDLYAQKAVALLNAIPLTHINIPDQISAELSSGTVAILATNAHTLIDNITVMESVPTSLAGVRKTQRRYRVEKAYDSPSDFVFVGNSAVDQLDDIHCNSNGRKVYYRVFGFDFNTKQKSNFSSNIATLSE